MEVKSGKWYMEKDRIVLLNNAFDYDIYGTPEHLKGQCKIGDFS